MPHTRISTTGIDLTATSGELRINSEQIETLIDRLNAARAENGDSSEARDTQEKRREDSFGAL